jgi:3-mercaptopyruvate sulfurtransferase SseA
MVYDDDTGVRVARECWLLEYLGHRQVRLLHGGLNAWQQCGGPISTTASKVRRSSLKSNTVALVLWRLIHW